MTPAEQMVKETAVNPVPKPPNLKEGDLYATHEGILHLGEHQLRCYILNNGQHIIDAKDLEEFLKF